MTDDDDDVDVADDDDVADDERTGGDSDVLGLIHYDATGVIVSDGDAFQEGEAAAALKQAAIASATATTSTAAARLDATNIGVDPTANVAASGIRAIRATIVHIERLVLQLLLESVDEFLAGALALNWCDAALSSCVRALTARALPAGRRRRRRPSRTALCSISLRT